MVEHLPIETDLWPAVPPGHFRPAMEAYAAPQGAVAGVLRPTLRIHRPGRANGTAVIVLGGGGYRHIQMTKAGDLVTPWLLEHGFTVVVMTYRLPNDGWQVDAPFQDIGRAVRVVRNRAQQWSLDPGKIGVMGFSAGGHLAAMAVTGFDRQIYEPEDEADALSARPDFAALLFPVISLQPPLDTTATKQVLIGQGHDCAAATRYSPDEQVRPDTPPVFLAHAEDDPIAAPEHSMRMYAALRRAKVPGELHVFETGGHGLAFGAEGSGLSAWPGLFLNWARLHGFCWGVQGV